MKVLWSLPAVVWIGLMTSTGWAAMKTQTVEYKQGNTTLKGYLAYDDAQAGKRPGVVVYPEWWGLTEYPQWRAQELAKLGYVAFVADMYGEGKTTQDAKQAGAWMTPIKQDRALMRARAQAALEQLKAQPNVDGSKLAAIGYCFGGTTALELARSGAPLLGVVSFHGNLDTPDAASDQIHAKILACTGGADQFVSPKEVEAFKKEMEAAHADWQLITYGGAHHAFTNPKADQFKIPNIAYNAEADHRSWAAMQLFFAEIFGTQPAVKPVSGQ
jgi:dienelactone hydrolase